MVFLRPSLKKEANTDITNAIANTIQLFLTVPLRIETVFGVLETGILAEILFSIFLIYDAK